MSVKEATRKEKKREKSCSNSLKSNDLLLGASTDEFVSSRLVGVLVLHHGELET